MDIPGVDPALLQRPMSELPKLDKTPEEGVQVTGAEALEPKQDSGATGTPGSSEEDTKVPYKRFKKFHDRALEAEQEAEFWKQRAMETQSRPEPNQNYYQPPAPDQYVEPVYGGPDWDRFRALFAGADENAVKEAYKLEVQRSAAIEQRAIQRAQEAFEKRSQAQTQELRANREYLDDWTDQAEDLFGRTLTDDEELALLEVMEEYSPTDKDGRIENPISPEAALRIYQMQTSQHSQRREARNAIASVSSASSGGDTTVAQQPKEQNKDFNAQLGWRANFRRMTGRNPEIT